MFFLKFTHFFVKFCRDRRLRAFYKIFKILASSLFSFPCLSQILSSSPVLTDKVCTRWPTRLDARTSTTTRRTSTTTTTNTGWTSFPIWQMTMDTTLAGQKKAKLVMSAIESYDIVDGGCTQTNVATAGEQLWKRIKSFHLISSTLMKRQMDMSNGF